MEIRDKKRRKPAPEIPPPVYNIVDGIRYVTPYVHEYRTSVKGRWLQRAIFEVLISEFGGHSPNYWANAIITGRVLVNGRSVDKDYIFRDNDTLIHKTHRHEPPVQGDIELVGQTADFVVVSKPPSMTMHPCGSYHHNSLMHILRYEPIISNQPNLLLVHRLDRVTSGIVILAKTPAAAKSIQEEIMGNRTKKTYLARVKGRFPGNLTKLNKLPAQALEWDHGAIRESAWGQGSEKADNRKRTRTSSPDAKNRGNATSASSTIDYSELCDEVYAHPEVGYGNQPDGRIILRCAVGVVSSRDGVHSNNPVDGKEAFTSFMPICYCEADDTTLVECQPLTGRTHQIRLHLQLLGNPIANDPCYGGELFFGEPEKKDAAVLALSRIREMGKQPLGNVSHVLKLMGGSELIPRCCSPLSVKGPGTEGWNLSDDAAVVSEAELEIAREEGETDEQYLVRTCRYCIGGLDENLERVLHCDGIWLHALQYEGEKWRFRTRLPDWARNMGFDVRNIDKAHGVQIKSVDCQPGSTGVPLSISS